MASLSLEEPVGARTGNLLFACVAEHGSQSHPYFRSETLLQGTHATRNLADAVHSLCTLHGRHPGAIDLAATRITEPAARAWLTNACEAFAVERLYLARLAVAAGPVPSTPGGGATETLVQAQRSAISTLAQSERRGCALGLSLALVADWAPVRTVLDCAALRFDVEVPPFGLSGSAEVRAVANAVGAAVVVERALLFGAQQVLVQHRGLWDLLEARQQARRDY